MIIGIPKEIKDSEYRVAVVPAGAKALAEDGHRVLVERGAGIACGIENNDYRNVGAEVVVSHEEVFHLADMIVKVKEPMKEECLLLRDGQILFTFLHLAPLPDLAEALMNSGCSAIAYETVELPDGRLPILAPMSEVAGRLSAQLGAYFLLSPYGGKGILLSGVPGVEKGRVLILGGGNAGINAARIALGLGADVTVMDIRSDQLHHVDELFKGAVKTLASNPLNIEKSVFKTDLLIGAVLMKGGRAPRLITKELVLSMKKGSVIVDISIDQGGCVDTMRPTTHSEPVYKINGIIHYGVANIPGSVPRTSTFALANAVCPYMLSLAKQGLDKAIELDSGLAKGVNIYKGRITHRVIANALEKEYTPIETLI